MFCDLTAPILIKHMCKSALQAEDYAKEVMGYWWSFLQPANELLDSLLC